MKIHYFAMAMAVALSTMSCSQKEAGPAYIGPSEIKIEDGLMSPEALLSLGRLSDPVLSPDGKSILYGVSYTSIEENRTCRNLFLMGTDGSGKVQLTKEGRSISNARFSPDGKYIFYVQGGQIWKAPFNGKSLGKPQQVTEIKAGVSEFRLSPDGKWLLYSSTVPGAVKTPKDSDPKLDKAQAYVVDDLMYRHWDHWTTERPQVFLSPLEGGMIKDSVSAMINILGEGAGKYELPLEPSSGMEQLNWSPDGKYVAYSCKKVSSGKEYAFSTDTEIYFYNVATGATTMIPMGGGYDTDPIFSPDGSKIAWISMARNGYEADKTRLFVADFVDGAVSGIRELTSAFKYNATNPVWSADSKSLYFCALTEGLGALYKVPADTSAQPARLTPEDAWYDFGGIFGFSGDLLLASYASMEFPTELVAVNEKDGGFTQLSHENDHILSQLKPYKTEAKWLETVDGKEMLTWILYPPQFDSTKVYPAIEIFLGGPQGTLSQEWSYRWNYRLMCNQGYIVVLPNRRGTTAFGQDWCEEISGDYIGLNMQDYLSAGRMIKAEPYVGKLAGCGASYGGYSVYYMAGIHGDTYDCFIAHAGIFDEKYMYGETEELWFPNWDNGGLTEYAYTPGEVGPHGDGKTFGGMQQAGSPWSDAPKARRHYANSPDMNVTKWHTPILCIHGMMDFRIPYDQGMEAFNAAQMMGVPSKLVVFPEENHWIIQPQNALFWHRTYFDWLDRWCK